MCRRDDRDFLVPGWLDFLSLPLAMLLAFVVGLLARGWMGL